MIPEIIFKSGDYFGELALLNRRGRAGTVVTLTDSFFSVISYDSYERLLKKDQNKKMQDYVRFLREIPYVHNWLVKETQGLFKLCENNKRQIASRDELIIKEGDPCKSVIIVISGELEIVKRNLNDVFFNEDFGVVGIKE